MLLQEGITAIYEPATHSQIKVKRNAGTWNTNLQLIHDKTPRTSSYSLSDNEIVLIAENTGVYTVDTGGQLVHIYKNRPALPNIQLSDTVQYTQNLTAVCSDNTCLEYIWKIADIEGNNILTTASDDTFSINTTGLLAHDTGTIYYIGLYVNELGYGYSDYIWDSFKLFPVPVNVSISDTVQTYDGYARAVQTTTDILGLDVEITYNGSTTIPINAGDYQVVARVTTANYSGSATAVLHIEKASASIILSNLQHTFDSTGKTATAVTFPSDLNCQFYYEGDTILPINAGKYEIRAIIRDNNYTGETNDTLIIDKAMASISFSDLTHVYNGNVKSVNVATQPVGLQTITTYFPNNPILWGTYSVYAQIDDPNYEGEDSAVMTITKPQAVITLLDSVLTYNGNPHSLLVNIEPVGTQYTITYNGLATLPVAAGQYSILVTTNDTTVLPAYATATLTIDKAPVAIAVGNTTQTYSGTGKSVSVSTAPANLSFLVTYNGSAINPVHSGFYNVLVSITDSNYVGTQTATLTINKALASITYSNLQQTYNASALSPTIVTTPADLYVQTLYQGAANVPINAGNYHIISTIVDSNYYGVATDTFRIAKATASIVFANLRAVYSGITRSAGILTVPSGLNMNILYNNSPTLPLNVGIYVLTATINDTNYEGTATEIFEIEPDILTYIIPQKVFEYNADSQRITPITVPSAISYNITYNGGSILPILPNVYIVHITSANPNYVGDTTFLMEITPKKAKVTFYDHVTTYNEQNQFITVNVEPSNIAHKIEYFQNSVAVNEQIVSGIYDVKVTITEPYYVLDTFTSSFTILKTEVGAIDLKLLYNYDGTEKHLDLDFSQAIPYHRVYIRNGDTVSPINAGKYQLFLVSEDTNYYFYPDEFNYEIFASEATLSFDTLMFTFDNTPKNVSVSTQPAGLAVRIKYEGKLTPPYEVGAYFVTATIVDDNYYGTIQDSMYILPQSPNAVINHQSSEGSFVLYPNPANDYIILKINGLTGEIQAEIIDISGKTVQKQDLYSEENTLHKFDISGLQSGSYILLLKTDNQLKTLKILKK
ncbi:MAG: MBG domain-containing protein [Bacteroidales bacterium]|nr:MBG domain-containing protein [Bacteroidales bacterium]